MYVERERERGERERERASEERRHDDITPEMSYHHNKVVIMNIAVIFKLAGPVPAPNQQPYFLTRRSAILEG